MTTTKQIQSDQWLEHLSLFSNGNKGREATIKLLSPDEGDYLLAENIPLMAVDYDPVGKGNDLVITVGQDSIEATHTVQAPVELLEMYNENGQVVSLEIVDQNTNKIILDLQ